MKFVGGIWSVLMAVIFVIFAFCAYALYVLYVGLHNMGNHDNEPTEISVKEKDVCIPNKFRDYDPKMDKVILTSVSIYGNYAVTSNLNHSIVLWDLKNHKSKIIATDGDIAFFVGDNHTLVWYNFEKSEQYSAEIYPDRIKIFKGINGDTGDIGTRYDIATDDQVNIFEQSSVNLSTDIYATSPDDKYIVEKKGESETTVCHNDSTKCLFKLELLSNKGLIEQPKNYAWSISMPDNKPVKIKDIPIAFKFIDNNHYLQFSAYKPWAILYDVTNPKPEKYIYLGEDPYPSIARYHLDETIDTSPIAHVLVTGQYNADGIIEYQYDPKTQDLTRTWRPHAPQSCSWVSE